MKLFAVFTKRGHILIALFRNAIDADWFMQTSNQNIPLVLEEIEITSDIELWFSEQ